MNKAFRWLCIAVLMAGLSACGAGGGDPGTSPFGSSTNNNSGGNSGGDDGSGGDSSVPVAASVEVLASATSVGTGGQDVTITAIVKDSGNASIASSPVAFSTTSGTISNAQALTDTAGAATATYSPGADRSNRNATVTVRSGTVTGSVSIAVTGSKLVVTGTDSLSLGGNATFTIKAEDSAGQPISRAPLRITSRLGNPVSASSASTDDSGQATFVYTGNVSGSDVLTIDGLGIAVTSTIVVSGVDFVFLEPNPAAETLTVPVNTATTIRVRFRQNGVGQAGRTVNFAATAGTLTANSAVTDGSGVATVNISSSSAAPSSIQATLVGGANPPQTSVGVRFVAVTPATLTLQASPTSLAPNVSGSTANQIQVSARVVDANDNPVPNVAVNFSRLADPSGGNLLSASDLTDANGIATVQYASGPQSTSTEGVKLFATVPTATNVSDDVAITVSQSALFIALGTGNTITNLNPETYKKDWTVYVTDANGVPVPSTTLTVKAIPTQYRKGSLTFAGSPAAWRAINVIFCPSEDKDNDGVLDLDTNEDVNQNTVLDPGNVISVTPGVITTDTTGRATISLIYAESYVPWVEIKLEVTAIVNGTESKRSAVFVVEGLSTDFSNGSIPPAGVESPFGTDLIPCPP